MNTEKTVSVDSRLTTNIFIKCDDGSFVANVYGELACFIGEASLVDPEKREYRCLRFESEQFVLDNIKNIHEMWLDFHKKITDYSNQHLSEFAQSHYKTPLIKIS